MTEVRPEGVDRFHIIRLVNITKQVCTGVIGENFSRLSVPSVATGSPCSATSILASLVPVARLMNNRFV